MNERIKLLADQARVLADEFQEQWKAGPSNEEFFQEKFAELIVRECARINFSNIVGIDPEDDAAVGRAIKKHFGVKNEN